MLIIYCMSILGSSLSGMLEGVSASIKTCKESLTECEAKGSSGSDGFKKVPSLELVNHPYMLTAYP
jgi:hypothetical protein